MSRHIYDTNCPDIRSYALDHRLIAATAETVVSNSDTHDLCCPAICSNALKRLVNRLIYRERIVTTHAHVSVLELEAREIRSLVPMFLEKPGSEYRN